MLPALLSRILKVQIHRKCEKCRQNALTFYTCTHFYAVSVLIYYLLVISYNFNFCFTLKYYVGAEH